MCLPYTYRIGWSNLNKHYYGVRYANDCSPEDFWIKYFTSSKTVHYYREIHGEPDIIEIRKIFNTKEQAIIWEHRVLKKLKVIKNDRWINAREYMGFSLEKPWNKGLKGMRGHKHTQESKEKIRKANLGKKKSTETRERMSKNMKGRTPWNKGLTGLQETHNKIKCLFISPTEEIYQFNSQAEGCKVLGLPTSKMSAVKTGKLKHYRGWKLEEAV